MNPKLVLVPFEVVRLVVPKLVPVALIQFNIVVPKFVDVALVKDRTEPVALVKENVVDVALLNVALANAAIPVKVGASFGAKKLKAHVVEAKVVLA